LQPDAPNAELGQRTIIGGGAKAAVADHGASHPTGELGDAVDRGDQLWPIRWVALLELVVGDKTTLVFCHQQGVAELGRMLRLALADRAGVRIGQ
jgi:hypothetical protein